jgi:hypothetical protein
MPNNRRVLLYKCSVCVYESGRINNLQQHMKRMHPGAFMKDWQERITCKSVAVNSGDAKKSSKYVSDRKAQRGQERITCAARLYTHIARKHPELNPTHSGKPVLYKCPVCVYEGREDHVCLHLAHTHPELFPSITLLSLRKDNPENREPRHLLLVHKKL